MGTLVLSDEISASDALRVSTCLRRQLLKVR